MKGIDPEVVKALRQVHHDLRHNLWMRGARNVAHSDQALLRWQLRNDVPDATRAAALQQKYQKYMPSSLALSRVGPVPKTLKDEVELLRCHTKLLGPLQHNFSEFVGPLQTFDAEVLAKLDGYSMIQQAWILHFILTHDLDNAAMRQQLEIDPYAPDDHDEDGWRNVTLAERMRECELDGSIDNIP